jgi:hypothetical protein
VGILLPNGNCVPREYVFDSDGDARLSSAELPDPFRRDVYVEVDWMPGQEYTMSAFDPVVAAFANAPVPNPDPRDPEGEKDGRPGIALHVQLGEEASGFGSSKICLAGQEHLRRYFAADAVPPSCSDVSFAAVRAKYFMPSAYRTERPPRGRTHYWPTVDEIRSAREMVYRYALLVEEIDGTPGYSGLAQSLRASNDLAVAPGSVSGGIQSQALQCPTYNKVSYAFMHELGHTFGLGHGGGDDVNNKPNYLSVMNYAYISAFCGTLRPRLDFSDWDSAPVLNEAALIESEGLGGPVSTTRKTYLASRQTVYGQRLTLDEFRRRTQGVALTGFPPPWNSNCVAEHPEVVDGRLRRSVAAADGRIDWNQDCRIDERAPVNADINAEPEDAGESPSNPTEVLRGWNDWARLDYDFRDDPYYTLGVYKGQ